MVQLYDNCPGINTQIIEGFDTYTNAASVEAAFPVLYTVLYAWAAAATSQVFFSWQFYAAAVDALWALIPVLQVYVPLFKNGYFCSYLRCCSHVVLYCQTEASPFDKRR
jgi:hypothetical protein